MWGDGKCALIELPARLCAAFAAAEAASFGSLAAHSSPAANGRMGFRTTAAASATVRGEPSLPALSATSNASASRFLVSTSVLSSIRWRHTDIVKLENLEDRSTIVSAKTKSLSLLVQT